jgi:hypothetical protein
MNLSLIFNGKFREYSLEISLTGLGQWLVPAFTKCSPQGGGWIPGYQ